MKHFEALLSLVVTAIVTSSFAAEKTVISAAAELKDGSSVKDEFFGDGINGFAIFAENLKLDMDIVRSVVFSGRGGTGGIIHEWNTDSGSGDNGLMFGIDGLRPMASCPHVAFSSLVRSERILREPSSGWNCAKTDYGLSAEGVRQ